MEGGNSASSSQPKERTSLRPNDGEVGEVRSTHLKSSCSRRYFLKLKKDWKNRLTWKLKAVYFLFLSGIVILWAQLSIHQASLNLSERDNSDFVSVSSAVTVVIPYLSGFVADKFGNFSHLLSSLMAFMGVTVFFFLLIPPIKMVDGGCNDDSLQLINSLVSIKSEEMETPWQVVDELIEICKDMKSGNITDLTSGKVGANSSCDVQFSKNNLIFKFAGNRTLYKCNGTNKTRDVTSYAKTYWSYLTVRTSFLMLTGASFTLFDGAVMAMEKEFYIDYGLQRAWGTLAAMTSSYAGGFLVDFYSEGNSAKDFTLMFYGSGICCVLSSIVMSAIHIDFKQPAVHYTKDLLNDLRSVEAISLLSITLFKGLFMGYAETFMYLFMFKLGANSSLIALTITVGAAFEILLQLSATPLTEVFGNIAVISIGIFCYSIRFVGFSYAYNPATIVGLEVLDAWASGLTSTATNMYCTVLSSSSTIASMRGLIGALHDGIGKYLGAKLGITIKESLGERAAWRVMALWALTVSAAYPSAMAFYKWARKKNAITRSQNLTKPEEEESYSGASFNKAFES